eukprot:gnl/TRDRNA2_/TRDRNA2_177608_c3_seq15.p1 gnl/TRDRNA2_/TRDRNA2_177608_c3~~gnl/TRDRNA2_/TRDRNA2_177608_c3_seq15.p1  ORF type:complete len:311 (+),score=89.51 gnl/TRDRNA2_/TRDRNA2_177608_c3_seq15:91-933(+)
MSYAASPTRASPAAPATKQQPLLSSDADSVHERDCELAVQAVKKIQELAAMMRRETSQVRMAAANGMGKRRFDVQEAMREAKATYDDANRHLQGLSVSGDSLPMSEQQMWRLKEKKLKDGLATSMKQLENVRKEYEEAEHAKATAAAAVDQSAVQMAAIDGTVDVEAANQQQMMEEMRQEAEKELHAYIVDEYASEVSTVHRDVQVLQQCMVDLAEHVQSQGSQLDNIELHMQSARDNTSSGAKEVLLTAERQRRGTKWMYWLLILIVIGVAILTIFILR